MKKNYNIALIPVSHEHNQHFIDLATHIVDETGVRPDYRLTNLTKSSIPHISVFQFSLENPDELAQIWQDVLSLWSSIHVTEPALLSSQSMALKHKTDAHGLFAGVSWIEMAIKKSDKSDKSDFKENQWLYDFHERVFKKISARNIACLNAHGARYAPHFTLLNTRGVTQSALAQLSEVPAFPAIDIQLMPVIGQANHQWELIDVMYQPYKIIAADELKQKAHFTNGTYVYAAERVIPTSLAGFEYVNNVNPAEKLPMVIAINSDKSLHDLGINSKETQTERAAKVALPLAKAFPDQAVFVIFYDEPTPKELYQKLHQSGLTASLHKWGYGIDPAAPIIEGAEFFEAVYAFPLPDSTKPVCHAITTRPTRPNVCTPIRVVDINVHHHANVKI